MKFNSLHALDQGKKALDLGTGRFMIGSHVKKQIGDNTFKRGRVIGYDESLKLYKVLYDNKTGERLEWLDLEPTLLYRQHESTTKNRQTIGSRSLCRWPKQRSLNKINLGKKQTKRHR
eukprot:Gb_29687 [translate_table: standard]